MDPFVTPLLVYVLGNLARELITDACKDHLKDKLKSLFGWLGQLGERDKVELTYQALARRPSERDAHLRGRSCTDHPSRCIRGLECPREPASG